MKTLFALLLFFSAEAAFADNATWTSMQAIQSQVQNNTAAITTLQTQMPVTAINVSNGVVALINSRQYISALATNVVLSSSEIVLYSTNTFTFSGSNYVGRFSQFFDSELTVPTGAGIGLSPPTNQFEEIVLSFTGTNNWFVPTNGFYAFTNISVAVIGASGGFGSVKIFGVDHPELYGRTNGFFGQHFQFSPPINPSDGATKGYVDATVHVMQSPVMMAGGWVFDSEASSTTNETVSFIEHNVMIFQMLGSFRGVHFDGFAIDGTGTNGLLTVNSTNLVSGWFVEQCTNLMPPIAWTTFTNYTSVTNTGELTLTLPINPNLVAQFFRIRNAATVTATFTVPVTATAFNLTPGTVTNSTDSTFGFGAGLMKWDTNYVYVSVGSNSWKRASLATW